jgi:hypothetical protein
VRTVDAAAGKLLRGANIRIEIVVPVAAARNVNPSG